MYFISLLSATLLLLSAATPAATQSSAADPWKIAAELSLTDQSGNRVLRLLTGGFEISHRPEHDYRFDASVQSRYGRSEGDLVTLSHQAGVALDLRPNTDWSPFLSVDAERDRFKRLDVRVSTGAGAKYTYRGATDRGPETSLSLALLHSFEQIAPSTPDEEPEPGAIRERQHRARWSLRGRTEHKLSDGLTVRHTTFFQPQWGHLANYLLRSDTGMKVLLTERLALAVDYEFKRDARPPPGIGPDDRLFKTGLIINF